MIDNANSGEDSDASMAQMDTVLELLEKAVLIVNWTMQQYYNISTSGCNRNIHRKGYSNVEGEGTVNRGNHRSDQNKK